MVRPRTCRFPCCCSSRSRASSASACRRGSSSTLPAGRSPPRSTPSCTARAAAAAPPAAAGRARASRAAAATQDKRPRHIPLAAPFVTIRHAHPRACDNVPSKVPILLHVQRVRLQVELAARQCRCFNAVVVSFPALRDRAERNLRVARHALTDAEVAKLAHRVVVSGHLLLRKLHLIDWK